MSFLLSHGADVNAVDEKNVNACLMAAATGKSCRAHLCITGVRPCHTPLLAALEHESALRAGCRRMLEELISSGANVNIAAHGGVTALHVAAESGHLGIVQTLLQVLPCK